MKEFTKEQADKLKELAIRVEVGLCQQDPGRLEALVAKDMCWFWTHHYLEHLEKTMDKGRLVALLGFDPYA